MKKHILISSLLFSSLIFSQKSGQLEIGIFGGIPTSSIGKYYSASMGLNVAYSYPVTEQLSLGLATGWGHYFSKQSTVKASELNYFPLAAKAKYTLKSAPLSFNLDLGTALYSSEKLGFYAFPKVAYNFGKHEVYLGYQHLSTNRNVYGAYNPQTDNQNVEIKNANYGSVSVGYNFVFK